MSSPRNRSSSGSGNNNHNHNNNISNNGRRNSEPVLARGNSASPPMGGGGIGSSMGATGTPAAGGPSLGASSFIQLRSSVATPTDSSSTAAAGSGGGGGGGGPGGHHLAGFAAIGMQPQMPTISGTYSSTAAICPGVYDTPATAVLYVPDLSLCHLIVFELHGNVLSYSIPVQQSSAQR